ncbi:MAG: hypothetical protein AAF655_06965 [Bacteroidota bacterium]
MKATYIAVLFTFLLSLISHSTQAQDMNNESLEEILYGVSDTLAGEKGAWEFVVEELPMFCLTDETHNRMRIISPIAEMKDITDKQLQEAMEANFHSALDVKYAISGDVMWVAYIHPLKELQKDQVISAISQVYYGHLTFGTTYTSSDLAFPRIGEQPIEEAPEKPLKKKDTGRKLRI